VELLDGLSGDEQLEESVHEAHDGGDVDKELLLEKLRIVLGEDADGLGAGGLDGRVLAEEADGLVVVDLEDLVRVEVGRDGLGCRRQGEILQGELHEGDAPVDKAAGACVSMWLASVLQCYPVQGSHACMQGAGCYQSAGGGDGTEICCCSLFQLAKRLVHGLDTSVDIPREDLLLFGVRSGVSAVARDVAQTLELGLAVLLLQQVKGLRLGAPL